MWALLRGLIKFKIFGRDLTWFASRWRAIGALIKLSRLESRLYIKLNEIKVIFGRAILPIAYAFVGTTIDDEQVDRVKQNTELPKPVRIAFNM